MWRWMLVVFAGVGLILGFMAWSTWNDAVNDRRNAERNRSAEENKQKHAQQEEAQMVEQREFTRMAGAAKAFLGTLGNNNEPEQLSVTTKAFQERNKVSNGCYRPSVGLIFHPHGGSWSTTEFGTCQSGEFFYRGEVHRDKKEAGKYTLVMRRDKQDNAWRVDGIVVEMKE